MCGCMRYWIWMTFDADAALAQSAEQRLLVLEPRGGLRDDRGAELAVVAHHHAALALVLERYQRLHLDGLCRLVDDDAVEVGCGRGEEVEAGAGQRGADDVGLVQHGQPQCVSVVHRELVSLPLPLYQHVLLTVDVLALSE